MVDMNGEVVGFWERLFGLRNKYGYWEMIKLVVFIGFTITFIFMCKNFGENWTFERQKEMVSMAITESETQRIEMHSEHMGMREQIKPYVTELLRQTLVEMKCDRAFVIELHNGTNNTAGLPFIHCSMTYEEDAKDYEPIDEDYQNLSLSRFNFPEYLHKNEVWYGTVEEFKEIDKKAARRLKVNDANYLVITAIGSGDTEIGYFGFTYCDGHEPVDEKLMVSFIIEKVQKLVMWLDKDITEI